MSSARDRRIELVELVSDRSEPINVTTLARALSVTERTVRRDLNELRRSGIELVSVPGRLGGIVLASNSQASESAIPPRESVSHPSSTIATSVPASALIGRELELDEFQQTLDAIASGLGGTVTVLGEPGMGKTALLDALSTMARHRGFDTAWCYNLEQGTRTGVELWKQLVDGLRSTPQVEKDTPTDSSQAYVQLEREFKGRSSAEPAVVVIDDLQWADEHSLDLIRIASHLLPDSNVVLAIGCREPVELYSESFRRTIDTLARGRRHTSLSLTGLSPSDSMNLFKLNLRRDSEPVADFKAESLAERTGGNPMFIKELGSQGTDELPRRVTEAVFHRYDSLSGNAQTVLLHAAFLGREFSLGELAAVLAEHAGIDISAVVQEAAQARFVRFNPARGRYEFLHDLLPEAIIEPRANEFRSQMHLSTATGLQQLYGKYQDETVTKIASHYRNAKLVDRDERDVDWTLHAGEQSLVNLNWERAGEEFDWVIEHCQGLDSRLAEAYMGLAEARQHSQQRDVRLSNPPLLIAAFNIYVELDLWNEAVEVLIFPFQPYWGKQEITPYIERALEEAPTLDSSMKALLLGRLAICQAIGDGEFSKADGSLQQAHSLAEACGDSVIKARIFSNEAMASNVLSDFPRMYKSASNALESIDDESEWFLRLTSLYWLAQGAGQTGKISVARGAAIEMISLAERYGSLGHLLGGLERIGSNNLDAADWDACRSVTDRALALDPSDARFLWMRLQIECWTGDREAAERYLDRNIELIERLPPGPSMERGLFLRTMASGPWHNPDWDWSQHILREISIITASPLELHQYNYWSLEGLQLAATLVDDESLALQVQLASLEAYCSGQGPALFPLGLGLLARYLGDTDTAEAMLEDALQHAYPHGWCMTAAELGELYLDRSGPGDTAKAVPLLTEALERANKLGISISSRLCKLVSRARESSKELLSSRELEVLSLVATGLSNQQVAEELFLSRHTINRHMSNILQKTGATGRTDAVAKAMQQGLLSSE